VAGGASPAAAARSPNVPARAGQRVGEFVRLRGPSSRRGAFPPAVDAPAGRSSAGRPRRERPEAPVRLPGAGSPNPPPLGRAGAAVTGAVPNGRAPCSGPTRRIVPSDHRPGGGWLPKTRRAAVPTESRASGRKSAPRCCDRMQRHLLSTVVGKVSAARAGDLIDPSLPGSASKPGPASNLGPAPIPGAAIRRRCDPGAFVLSAREFGRNDDTVIIHGARPGALLAAVRSNHSPEKPPPARLSDSPVRKASSFSAFLGKRTEHPPSCPQRVANVTH